MLYEIHIRRGDGTTAKESFTAVNDKKAIQRIDSALERHAGPEAGGTYKLVDGRGRDVVREADIPRRGLTAPIREAEGRRHGAIGARPSGRVIDQTADAANKEAAQPFGERPKSREETPKKGMRPKAQDLHDRIFHTGV